MVFIVMRRDCFRNKECLDMGSFRSMWFSVWLLLFLSIVEGRQQRRLIDTGDGHPMWLKESQVLVFSVNH
jgi:hypothetical protein